MQHNGYTLQLDPSGRIRVTLRRQWQFTAATVGEAKRWIDAYRLGLHWAVTAKLEQEKGGARAASYQR